MNDTRLSRLRGVATAGVALATWAGLAWAHLHGGVPSHHLLARADLPSISNAWGGLLLPALTWFLVGRVHRRLARRAAGPAGAALYPTAVLAGFAGALVFGALLSVFFTRGQAPLTALMAQALVPLALLFPIYRAEYVLGFVLAMTYTFGAMLPTGFACAVALMAVVLYRGVRPLAVGLGRRLVRAATG